MAQENINPETDTKAILLEIIELTKKSQTEIEQANQIDLKNKNGFEIDFKKIEEIEEKISDIEIAETKNIGTICAIYDGNTYCLLELALKSIITKNSLILVTKTKYMEATNAIILAIIKKILEENKTDKNLIQQLITSKIEELLTNKISINKVIAIGNKKLQNKILKESEIETINSGYGNFDVYIEDTTNIEDIKDLIEYNKKVDIYVKKGIKTTFKKYIEVEGIEEAIALINFNTAGYSSSIFTTNKTNSEKFIKQTKTTNTYVNRNPFADNMLNISINEFLKIKTNIKAEISEKPTEEEKKETEEKIKKQDEIQEENNRLQEENEKMEKEITILKENSESLRKGNELKIQELTKRLNESQTLAKKYMSKFANSKLSRIFGKLKKEEIERDRKMLS